MSPRTIIPAVFAPAEAAAKIGIPVGALVAILRRHRYPFIEIHPGGKPGDRGRNRWGMTAEQIEAVLKGQKRQFEPEPAGEPAASRVSAVSPDGKSRLRRRKAR